MAQVIITRRIYEEAEAVLTRAGLETWHNQADVPLGRATLGAKAAEAEAIICLLTDLMGAAVMGAAPHLKIIANVAVGYDNIDVAAHRQRRHRDAAADGDDGG